MNIKRLRHLLDQYPDEAEVRLLAADHECGRNVSSVLDTVDASAVANANGIVDLVELSASDYLCDE